MLGAIIGDIVGSAYEFNPHKSKDFPLFSSKCDFTDDTVMTVAIANSLILCKGNYDNLSSIASSEMRRFASIYPNRGYGINFARWLKYNNLGPYNSYGNGAAMRIGAVGIASSSIEEAKKLSYMVTKVSHNHSEGLKGAEVIAVLLVLIRQGKKKTYLKKYVQDNYYNLNFTIDEIRENYHFDESCQNTVPQAIKCFLEAKDFEDTLRNCVSLGGDADTMCAIAGVLAEAYYKIPEKIVLEAKKYIPEMIWKIIDEFYDTFKVKFF